jgi:triacylglycerol esterase/lipase EstA (alpha/beta hydrolase family)
MQHTTTELLPVGSSGGTTDVIANVVFVHGLGGHNRGTWQSDSTNEETFWPQWLYDDLNARSESGFRPPVGVWSLGYPAEVFRVMFFSKNRDDSVPQRARQLVDTLLSHGLANRPIIFVVHSLGGILVKQMLRSSRDAGDPRLSDFPKLALSTRLVIFLATPHTGSSMARLAEAAPAVSGMLISGLLSTVEWLPLGGIPRWLARKAIQRGRFTKALESGDPYLEDLGTWYRDNAPQIGIDSRAYYENAGPLCIGVVVDKGSANPGVSGCEAIALDGNHFSICKPESRNEHYKRIKQPIRQAISKCPAFKETHLAALDVGERFEKLAELIPADRMRAVKKVVQPIEKRLGRDTPIEYDSSVGGDGAFSVPDWQAAAAAISPYDLDRIILSVWREYRGGCVASDPTQCVRHEVELLRQTGLENRKELSLPPLYYAARALRTQRERGHVQMSERAVADVRAALAMVEELAGKFGMDEDRSTRNALRALIDAT